MRSVVLLSRRHRLYAAAADWNLPDVELYLCDSPSEALARTAMGQTSVFVFDARDYPRYRHVARKFFDLKTDADMVLVGQPDAVEEVHPEELEAAVRHVEAEAEPDEIQQVVMRLLQLQLPVLPIPAAEH